MYDMTFDSVCEILDKAVHPEDVFGIEKNTDEYRITYFKVANLVHPDKHAKSNENVRKKAHKATSKLNALWELAVERLKAGTYGQRKEEVAKSFQLRKCVYTIGKCIHKGLLRSTFTGTCSNGGVSVPVIIKLPHAAADNDLVVREAKALDKIKTYVTTKETDYKHIHFDRVPVIGASGLITEPGVTSKRMVSVFAMPTSNSVGRPMYSLVDIRKRYPDGIDQRVMAFIFNRVLETLVIAHKSGVVHGAVRPEHILIDPVTHMGMLVDWTCAIFDDYKKVPYYPPNAKLYLPEEDEVKPTKSADIYGAAWSMSYLLGSGPNETHKLNADPRLVAFLNKCVQTKRHRRFNDAALTLSEFKRLIDSMWPRKFINFEM